MGEYYYEDYYRDSDIITKIKKHFESCKILIPNSSEDFDEYIDLLDKIDSLLYSEMEKMLEKE